MLILLAGLQSPPSEVLEAVEALERRIVRGRILAGERRIGCRGTGRRATGHPAWRRGHEVRGRSDCDS